jgi:hypothetical protein
VKMWDMNGTISYRDRVSHGGHVQRSEAIRGYYRTTDSATFQKIVRVLTFRTKDFYEEVTKLTTSTFDAPPSDVPRLLDDVHMIAGLPVFGTERPGSTSSPYTHGQGTA